MFSPGDTLNNVLFGHDDWMFLWQGGASQFDFLMGEKHPTPESIQNFTSNIEERARLCAARGLPYVHVVFPSKPVVMTEFLPATVAGRTQSLFERHYSANARADAPCPVLYPRARLMAEKAMVQVFSKHDTHMTAVGNAIVCEDILARLGQVFSPLEHMASAVQPRGGDLADMVGLRNKLEETCLFPAGRADRMFDNRQFLPSNTNNIAIVRNPRSASDQRLLVVGDSFIKSCLQALSSFYRDILYVRSETFQPDILDLFAPDAVVTANAERYLCKVHADADGDSILLRGYGYEAYKPSAEFVNALRAQLAYRSYPARYREWAAQHDGLCFPDLGPLRMNSQVEVVPGHPGAFLSSGPDPQLLLDSAVLEAGNDYRLSIRIETGQDGLAQLFVGQIGDAGKNVFLEQFSERRAIKVGANVLQFHIPDGKRSGQLRFDPLSAPGRFRVTAMELTRHSPT